MAVALITHEACLDHDTGEGHPERPDRLRAVQAALAPERFPGLVRIEAPRASAEQIARVHDAGYVQRLLATEVPPGELRALDPDTILSPGSIEAALRAAGGATLAVDLVMQGQASAAFAAVRPPGHHARPATAMGFCLFNNVAVAAHHARDRWGLRRIAVADFDVHHGNGTQEEFWQDPDLFFASSHQSPAYPGTGRSDEQGAAGNVANAPLPPGAGGAEFRRAWERVLLPALDQFAPELVIVSAGFDAHRRDPLAQMMLEAEDYGWITRELVALAGRHAQGRVISLLEGGYDLEALAESSAAHVAALDA
ncbi:histone deacetylase family protein [Novosphingobium sp. JCM 18896]|uniref:histone deacetylase family protein n=1 Tax=Novosphingobium sp. JCM 18896 TaxID=2989731 RepID=UPI0022219935|nr:histone deacetylase family protein [Novosphingobium sp. JCM 18896]MCW1429667.1 histone deacetylase family protein [Novosphingobium sp. JCM 18896]